VEDQMKVKSHWKMKDVFLWGVRKSIALARSSSDKGILKVEALGLLAIA
jgi:hypothetical protein